MVFAWGLVLAWAEDETRLEIALDRGGISAWVTKDQSRLQELLPGSGWGGNLMRPVENSTAKNPAFTYTHISQLLKFISEESFPITDEQFLAT